jgi:TatD DNase family protein
VLVDTHCHLAAAAFDPDREAVLERAWASGVGHLVVIGETPAAAERALALAAADPRISATAGLHPHEASHWNEETDRWLGAVLEDPRVVAVGETGLDYHYDHAPRAVQREVFERQLELAAHAGRPAVIHARDADDDVAAVLRRHPGVTAILHSFAGGPALLRAALEGGHYVSFSGMVTFRNWNRDDAVRGIPLDRLLVETDAPYLAPTPYRGRRNEPALIRHTAERLAAVRGISPGELIRLTGENARRVFGDRVGLNLHPSPS